jgi:hypothetical protein
MRRDRTVGEFSGRKFNCHIFHKGVWFDSLQDIARMYGVKYSGLRYHLKKVAEDPVNSRLTDCEMISLVVNKMIKCMLSKIEVTIK